MSAIAWRDVVFEPDTHTYWYGMEQLPSVSEILRPLTESYLAAIPEATLNWKRDLGIAVHEACELYDLELLDETTLDERIVPYLEGYKRFWMDMQPSWDAIERLVVEPDARYAGRLDRAGRVAGRATILDIKTSVAIQPSTAIQLWAYAMAYDEMAAPDLAVLQLKPDGSYAYRTFTDYDLYSETWDALLTIHRWKQREATR